MIPTRCALLSCVGSDIAYYLPPSIALLPILDLSSSLPSFVLGEEGRRKVCLCEHAVAERDADVVSAHVPPQLVAGVSLRRHQQRAAKTRLGCHLPGLRRRRQLSQPSPGASASSLCKQRARRKPGRCRRRRPVCRMAMRHAREGEGYTDREGDADGDGIIRSRVNQYHLSSLGMRT